MAIVIQNVTKNPTSGGECEYVVRINADEICRFTHKRSEGLAVCLHRAAEAVEKEQLDQILSLLRAANMR